jgi:predicted ATPase/DNA-binding SARP family transcriptional activator
LSQLEIHLLGPFEVLLDGKPITGFESGKVRALLAYLAAESRRPQRREHLAGLLWPDWPQKSAMSNLRYALADLRKNIGDREAQPPYLSISRESIQLNLESDCRVDISAFERPGSAHGGQTPAEAIYRGEFLEGITLADSPAFEDWVRAKREFYRRLILAALDDQTEQQMERGDHEAALVTARRAIEIELWHEPAHQHILRILAQQGRRVEAVTHYESLRKVLKDELDIEPSESTRLLYEQVRLGTVQEIPLQSSAPKRTNNFPAQLTSFIGRHREIATLISLLADHRLVTLTGSGGTGKSRLALHLAAEALENYADGAWLVELAPLADPAFVPNAILASLGLLELPGKSPIDILMDFLSTRRLLLMLDNCEHLLETCASLSDKLLRDCPELTILATSREILGINGEAAFRVPPMALPDAHHLQSVETLSELDAVRLFVERAQLVLPDFELYEGNATAVVQVVTRLDGIPLAIELAASRLRLLGIDQVAQRLHDAFRLLTGGSRTALPRHQTLRASIDWSYNLLSEKERILLRRLSVFAGSWRLQAAEAICANAPGPSQIIHPEDILDLLSELVDKSLVSAEQESAGRMRYRMLETIRQYAHEKLVDEKEAEALRSRHLAYYLDYAIEGEQYLRGSEQVIWQRRLMQEMHNFRAALSWALEQEVYSGLHLALVLGWVWYNNNIILEGSRWLNQFIAREEILATNQPRLPDMQWLHLWGLFATGNGEIAVQQLSGELEAQVSPRLNDSLAPEWVWWKNVQDYENYAELARLRSLDEVETEALLEHYRRLAQSLGAKGKRLLACYMNTLIEQVFGNGFTHLEEVDLRYAQVRKCFDEALEISHQSGSLFCLAEILQTGIGNTELGHNHYEQAVRNYTQALGLKEQLGDIEGMAHIKDRMATAFNGLGDFSHASQLLDEALALYNQTRGYARWKLALVTKGTTTWCLGDEAKAEKLYLQAREHSRDKDFDYHLGGYYLGCLAYLHRNYREAEHYLLENDRFFRQKVGQVFWADHYLAMMLFGLGEMALHQDEVQRARKYLEDALAHHLRTPFARLHAVLHFALGKAASRQGQVNAARAYYAEALPQWGPHLGNPGLVYTLQALAELEAESGRYETAARLLGCAYALQPRLSNPYFFLYIIRLSLEPVDAAAIERTTRQALGEAAYAAALAEGQALDVEQAYALAQALCKPDNSA